MDTERAERIQHAAAFREDNIDWESAVCRAESVPRRSAELYRSCRCVRNVLEGWRVAGRLNGDLGHALAPVYHVLRQ